MTFRTETLADGIERDWVTIYALCDAVNKWTAGEVRYIGGAGFWRKRREILLGHNRFCSRGCYQEWQRGKPKVQHHGL